MLEEAVAYEKDYEENDGKHGNSGPPGPLLKAYTDGKGIPYITAAKQIIKDAAKAAKFTK